MRERLVVTLVAMTVAMIVAFGAVLAYSTADLVRDQDHEAVAQAADLAAVAISGQLEEGATRSFLDGLTHPGQTITYVAADGTTTSTRKTPRDDDVSATRPVQDGGGRVILTQDASVSSNRISDQMLPLVVLGLTLAALAGIIGWLLAARFARPFRRLAADATRIGEGHFDTPVHRSYIREAAELGAALRTAATQLEALVQRERELAVVASHELRTPLTALRLSLEDMTLWPEIPPAVADELHHSLAEVDRLGEVVTTLLEGDGGRLGEKTDLDLNDVAADAADRWSARARTAGRPLVLIASRPAVVRTVRAPVERIVDVLIENALAHGTGTVTVEIVTEGGQFRLRVSDEGARGIEPGIVHASPDGSGSGLTEAATRAESLGGFIGVVDVPTTTVALVLAPARSAESGIDAQAGADVR
ncbi:sensor histidine kinase [Aeromicrobium wangtongii]|uniref:sensor histidine kinase n=1 Tax=Aeromicrobium wangtongii TaxID=2969247 RepID=UPI002016EA9B|nr:HAMP domain-containing sensor histidine kinase [Aeromicrobium wangtongii]MCL3817550.1 HAMP domain-containing histidine kinase [Aeromicrobium wangtongii]